MEEQKTISNAEKRWLIREIESGRMTIGEAGNNDFSYNAFNIDFIYSWRFAPGSTLSIAYKNAIENDGPFTTQNYRENLKDTWQFPQTNSFSIKLVYYLDYNYLKKKF